MSQPIKAVVSPSGQLSIPAELRKSMGIDGGGEVLLTLDGGELRVKTAAEGWRRAREKAQAILAQSGKSFTVDDFLAERKTYWRD
ncbi:AbrB/MazE/SpoVT family DNA-binding domain-containing protein [Prosthecomicrobium pneumaticum]|uniref:AbrB family looped-hinge helix DNA binding protein n=1 Tax=Prosthecomicrobium pneumaticum TaxID=81895 RepID=A0A7W9CUJ3_9HYPH|nr:AbrB/MazE/SpoVT family DNA-binding domain-containing protein [Prosthecomicrobium pneumaticum]MBB5752152.1 AbrB family looped-hinge helix DNA binding protein [Prosthecomicrobium pneumaticum]